MGKGSTPGVDPATQAAEIQNSDALTAIAQQQQAQSSQLFNLALPGVAQAENFYGSIASGSPYAIGTAIAPATAQISQATASAKQNILNNTPSGGEKNLALQQADITQGAQVGQAATGSFLNSFNALGALGGQNIGQSISAGQNAIYGLGTSNTGFGQIGTQELESQQIQAQEKGSTLGSLASLGGGIAEGAGTAMAGGKGASALAALAI